METGFGNSMEMGDTAGMKGEKLNCMSDTDGKTDMNDKIKMNDKINMPKTIDAGRRNESMTGKNRAALDDQMNDREDGAGFRSKVRLICLDIDGTILTTRQEITPATFEAVWRAQEKGIHVALVTGRMVGSALVPARALGIKDPLIALNGAFIRPMNGDEPVTGGSTEASLYDAGLRDLFMDRLTLKQILEVLLPLGIRPSFYSGHTLYIGDRLERYERLLSRMKDPRYHIRTIDDHYGYGDMLFESELTVRKGILFPEAAVRQKAFDALCEIPGLSVVSSSPGNIEITVKDASKGLAVHQLAEMLSIRPEEIMAIGDSDNDRSMLEMAGISVAMGNAKETIQKITAFITEDNDHDGAALAIRRYALGELC